MPCASAKGQGKERKGDRWVREWGWETGRAIHWVWQTFILRWSTHRGLPEPKPSRRRKKGSVYGRDVAPHRCPGGTRQGTRMSAFGVIGGIRDKWLPMSFFDQREGVLKAGAMGDFVLEGTGFHRGRSPIPCKLYGSIRESHGSTD